MLNNNLTRSTVGLAVFLAVALTQTYETSGCSSSSKFINSALFFVINYFLLKISSSSGLTIEQRDSEIAKYSLYSALLFFIITSSDTYELTNNTILGINDRCPTVKGVLFHSIIFFVLLILLSHLEN